MEAANMVKSKSRKTKSTTKTASSPDDQVEKLDFTLAAPPPTPHLSLHNSYGAHYEDAKWNLEPGGAMQFRLQVTEPEHTIFALEIYSPFAAWIEKMAERVKTAETPWVELQCHSPETYAPLMLTVSNEDLNDSRSIDQLLNPLSQHFVTKRIVLPPALLLPGDNFLTLWLSSDVGVVPLYLKSVSVSDFGVQRQQQTEWCWAAVTSSLMQFMVPDRSASQSDVVTHTFKKAFVQAPENLNQPWDITDAAKTMGLEDGTRYGNVSRNTMRDMVNEGVPIPIQINWRRNARKNGVLGDGHYVVVHNIGEEAKGQTLIQVEDPWAGKLNLTWDELKNDYPGKANRHLYQHKEQQQCKSWVNDACHCQWRGKWTYTHVLVPKEWAVDQEYDQTEYDKLIASVDQRLAALAEQGGFQDIFEQAQTEPTLEEITTQIEKFNYQVATLCHQLQDLQDVLENLEHMRQSLLGDSTTEGPASSAACAHKALLDQSSNNSNPPLAG
jgi:hypothetical protein